MSYAPGVTEDPDHTANLVGALALAVSGRTAAAMAAAADVSETAATALSALHHFLDRPSIDELRQVLGLTSSGTVRLVDSLARAGYVRRRPGRDARSTAVTLTASGRAAAKRVAAARAAALRAVLAPLSADERSALGGGVGRVLATLAPHDPHAGALCRQCDTVTCRTAAPGCPVGGGGGAALTRS
jgi:DNA-binding MarR family transcriptional regulator